MIHRRYGLIVAAGLVLCLAACSSSPDVTPPWQGRSRTPSNQTESDAAAATQHTTLGTPFEIDAQEISEGVAATVQLKSAKSDDPSDGAVQTLSVEHAELVLRSNGFTVALERLAMRLAPLPGESRSIRIESTRLATGTVIAADPDSLRADFDVPLRLMVNSGEQELTSDDDRPIRLALDVRRLSDEAVLGVSMAGEGATWKVGAVHLQARSISIEVRGPIAPPADH
ncbi:MAG: hypothetical protein HY898_30880 [Deltaproteobacteria bacterium]|nr:hypothetical protein [Deltaproteobacteria bacterium]